MSTTPSLSLRDQLALDRTELASRRTWLAAARTALALFVSGATFLQFFEAGWTSYVGWGFIGVAVPVTLIAYWRYRRELRKLRVLAHVFTSVDPA